VEYGGQRKAGPDRRRAAARKLAARHACVRCAAPGEVARPFAAYQEPGARLLSSGVRRPMAVSSRVRRKTALSSWRAAAANLQVCAVGFGQAERA